MARALLCLLLGVGCAPPLVDEPWLIGAPRVVAVTIEPPEAAPGAKVTLRAVVAGPAENLALRWATCEAPRAFSQNESVNPGCLAALADAPAADAVTEVQLAFDVCSRFGPDAPGAGARPRDADATGGYFQPVGVQLGEAASFAFVRLQCRPAGISFEVAQAYAAVAQPNTNPAFALRAEVEGRPVGFDELVAGAEVELRADWSATPEESFAFIDPSSGELGTQRERYDVSWFVTGGTLDQARSNCGAGRWQLPRGEGEGTLWAVLRDSRGGVSVRKTPALWR